MEPNFATIAIDINVHEEESYPWKTERRGEATLRITVPIEAVSAIDLNVLRDSFVDLAKADLLNKSVVIGGEQ